jgi:hypothetical protein
MREGFGPPAHLPRWAVALLLAAVAAIVVAVLAGGEDRRHLVLDSADPQFNLLYDDGVLRRATPQPGEVLRLEAARDGVRAAVVVRPIAIDAYRGDVSSGVLPVLAERHLQELDRDLPGFALTD